MNEFIFFKSKSDPKILFQNANPKSDSFKIQISVIQTRITVIRLYAIQLKKSKPKI